MGNQRLTDEGLRAAYQQALDARRVPGREGCVAPEAMLAVLRREGSEEQRLEVLDHVMACGACSSEFELLRSLELAAVAPTGRPVPAAPRMVRRIAIPLALVAAVLLVITVKPLLKSTEGPDVKRGTSRGVTLVAPPEEIAAGTPPTFIWKPVVGAQSYEIELLDEKGAVVWSTRTSDTSATLSDPAVLVPGKTYRWWVRATTAQPGTQRASPLRSLRIQTR
jgi:hypothetical protein